MCTSLSYFFFFFYFSFFVCEFEVQKYHKSKFQATTTTKCYGEQNSKPYLPTDMFLSLILYKFLLKIFFAFFISIFLKLFLRKNVFSFHRRIKFAAMSSPLTSRHAKLIKVQLGKFSILQLWVNDLPLTYIFLYSRVSREELVKGGSYEKEVIYGEIFKLTLRNGNEEIRAQQRTKKYSIFRGRKWQKLFTLRLIINGHDWWWD